MSIHAHLSPEARQRLEAQRRNSAISSVLISILIIVLLGLILAFILLPSLFVNTPTLVSYNVLTPDKEKLEEKKVDNRIKRERLGVMGPNGLHLGRAFGNRAVQIVNSAVNPCGDRVVSQHATLFEHLARRMRFRFIRHRSTDRNR